MVELILILTAFVIGFIGSLPATGPVSFMVLQRAMEKRYSHGTALSVSASIMDAIYCGLGVAFVGLLTQSGNFQIGMRIASSALFLVIGAYFIFAAKINSRRKKIKEIYGNGAHLVGGFLLVLFNPSVILTWAAVSSFLVYRGLVEFMNYVDVVSFSLSAGIGAFSGLMFLMFLVRRFRRGFSEKIINKVFKVVGVILVILAFENLLDLRDIIL